MKNLFIVVIMCFAANVALAHPKDYPGVSMNESKDVLNASDSVQKLNVGEVKVYFVFGCSVT